MDRSLGANEESYTPLPHQRAIYTEKIICFEVLLLDTSFFWQLFCDTWHSQRPRKQLRMFSLKIFLTKNASVREASWSALHTQNLWSLWVRIGWWVSLLLRPWRRCQEFPCARKESLTSLHVQGEPTKNSMDHLYLMWPSHTPSTTSVMAMLLEI